MFKLVKIEETLELLEEIDAIYANGKYEQVYMRSYKLIDLELLDYDMINSEEDEDLFS